MTRIDQGEAFLDFTFLQAVLHLRGDIDKSPAGRDFKSKLFPIEFHPGTSCSLFLCQKMIFSGNHAMRIIRSING